MFIYGCDTEQLAGVVPLTPEINNTPPPPRNHNTDHAENTYQLVICRSNRVISDVTS